MRGNPLWFSALLTSIKFVLAEGHHKDEGKKYSRRGLSLQKGGLLSYLHETG